MDKRDIAPPLNDENDSYGRKDIDSTESAVDPPIVTVSSEPVGSNNQTESTDSNDASSNKSVPQNQSANAPEGDEVRTRDVRNVYTANEGVDQYESQTATAAEIHEGGAEINENEPAEGQQEGADAASPIKRSKKPRREIPRYESASIDEEEFQDYFVNPIKRKEFDRQRKKQQMREMQNITGFTLGQFGIKSMKAMKEALPQYPDDEDEDGQDASKNYATVSLCCLSVTNPFRNKIIQIVSVSPWFDRFILTVILINCMFLALDKEIDAITFNIETIDFVFLIIYSWEMSMKIIAMGFFMRAHSYLRDSWNIMDFSVVVLGWAGKAMSGGGVDAIKVIRILRPLRTINQIPNMPSLVATIMTSLPILLDVTILFMFALVMLGTIATQLLGGHLEKRCIYTNSDGEQFTSFMQDSEADFICQDQAFCDSAIKDLKTTCAFHGNPISNTYSFDNVLLSLMNLFEMITLEGWTDMMYIVRDAEQTLVYDLFFISVVVIGNFIILNLVVAVQADFLDKAFDEEDAKKEEITAKIEARKQKKKEIEEAQEYGDETESDAEIDSEIIDEDSETGKRRTRKKQIKKSCFDVDKPEWMVKSSAKCDEICETPQFERLIIGLILANTLSMASEHYEEAQAVTTINEIANLFFTVVFLIELIMKVYGFGCAKYVDDNFNLFDCFIVIMSYIELVVPKSEGDGGGLGMLKTFRLLRIFKIIKSWESLKTLLSTVFDSLQAITNLGILICLFLFIFSLLCKQFFPEPLMDGEDPARYTFTNTGVALVTMFIILTGENWNEVMILVIDTYQSFRPAVLFIFMMLLGNFMLLNLFLAILLKSISEIDDGEDDGEIDPANNEDEEHDAQNALGGLNESAPLNSSNSNIEEEFEQIKNQLMALSNNMHGVADGGKKQGDLDQVSEVDSEERQRREEVKEKEDQAQNNDVALGEEEDESEKYKKQMALFIFSYDNPIRRTLRDIVSHSYFAGFIYHMIALNSLLLALDEPNLVDKYQKKSQTLILETISIIFVGEFVFKCIVMGFYYGERTYLKDPWNVLDFTIVFFSIITWVLEAYATGDVSFLRGFRALRALRPLRVVSKNEGIKTVVNALLESIPALINVLLIVILFLLVFGILGIQLFKGMLGKCNDGSEDIMNKTMCVDQYVVPDYDRFGNYQVFKNLSTNMNATNSQLRYKETVPGVADPTTTKEIETEMSWINQTALTNMETAGKLPGAVPYYIKAHLEDREWEQPFNRYDNILISMLTFFEITTLEMWPDMMFAAIDSVGYDKSPIEKNSPMVSVVYILFIFVTTFFIMNLFISVIVDKFNEQIKKRQGSDNFSNEQKEWVKIQRLLAQQNPKIIPVEPINCFRLQCFRIVQSQAFEYLVMFAIILNTITMCIDYHGKSKAFEMFLMDANLVFVVFFTVEMVVKLTAYGWKYYWYVNWNKFDFIIVMFSLAAIDEKLLEKLNFNVTALRIMRISRLFRMVKTSEGLRSLLKTLYMSMGNIFNTAALLTLILFTFSVAGMSLFGDVPEADFVNEHVNFRSFYLAMITLFRASTGESWNGIMHDCWSGAGIIAVIYWTVFQLISFFIFMNVFIAVIGESFNDNQQAEDENDILALKKKDIKAFQNTWAKYNPMGELYMRTIRLPDFLRELPPPLGYQGIRIEEAKLNKIIFCLNIRDHLGRVYYPEVMWTIFHSIAGMNDEKVLNCEQINNILKSVKHKYKGLGKKLNLDTLCGNKYYRKELTAIKYIQAMKILTKWRNFKNQKKKQKDEMMMQSVLANQQQDNPDAPPRAAIYEADRAENDSNHMEEGGAREIEMQDKNQIDSA